MSTQSNGIVNQWRLNSTKGHVKGTHQISLRPDLSIQFPKVTECDVYQEHLKRTWQIHMNIFNISNVRTDSITVVTHGDISRISNLKVLLQYWKGKLWALEPLLS